MAKPKIAIVIPTIRDLDFLDDWGGEFANCIGIIVEDHLTKEISTPSKYFTETFHYTWKDIKDDLGEDEWIIPRKNAGIRSYGFLKAFQLGVDYIITIDDDCYPIKNQKFVKTHVQNLSSFAPLNWFATIPYKNHQFTRGFPYLIRDKEEVVVSHGLWTNILDLDAPTQLFYPKLKIKHLLPFIEFIPKNYFFPMCSMNLAFKTKIAPLMYFPLMGCDPDGKQWGFDRFDDIWAGIFVKKIIDHLGLAATNGIPFVEHKRASNVFHNLRKEALGIEINEELFKSVDKIQLKSSDIKGCYLELMEKTNFPEMEYFKKLKEAIIIWLKLFD